MQFVDDGNEVAPAFDVTVNGTRRLPGLDQLRRSMCARCAVFGSLRRQTVTLSGANFGVSDPDSSSFTYTVSGVSGGLARPAPDHGFTSADLTGGLVQFVDDTSAGFDDGQRRHGGLQHAGATIQLNDAPVIDGNEGRDGDPVATKASRPGPVKFRRQRLGTSEA